MIDCLTPKEDDPKDDTVHQPYTAFNQGYDARSMNVPRRLNPYKPFSREWFWWGRGWGSISRGKYENEEGASV